MNFLKNKIKCEEMTQNITLHGRILRCTYYQIIMRENNEGEQPD